MIRTLVSAVIALSLGCATNIDAASVEIKSLCIGVAYTDGLNQREAKFNAGIEYARNCVDLDEKPLRNITVHDLDSLDYVNTGNVVIAYCDNSGCELRMPMKEGKR